jgi:SAM-dependent methyltransferase
MIRAISHCRICKNPHLVSVLDLGLQAMTGIFPRRPTDEVAMQPLELVKCNGPDACGLVQLKHSGDLEIMYGEDYGYRSGLNRWMVEHLEGIADAVKAHGVLKKDDLILDIGSNDATLLTFFHGQGYRLVGMDPSGVHFTQFYKDTMQLVPHFFTGAQFKKEFNDTKATVVTSIAMFYDLEDPQAFVNDIASILSDNGVWLFEQSYLPSMLKANAYDTVCHEHLEYYAMRQIEWLLERAGMTVLDVSLNGANGGSFRVTAVKHGHPLLARKSSAAEELRNREEAEGINELRVYEEFRRRVEEHKTELRRTIDGINAEGKKVFALGASTKGNVVLQYCGLTAKDIPYVAEVNDDKFGKCTPGSLIPIIAQADADAMKPDYYLVLPWHFRMTITQNMKTYLQDGGKLLFPLPEISVVGSEAL